MRELVFQPILVRPGTSTREGIVALAAVTSWHAAQLWPQPLRERWRDAGCLASVRAAHLRDYLKATGEGWVTNSTIAAGPPMVRSTAPDFAIAGKPHGWQAWGTVPPPKSDHMLMVPTMPELSQMCQLAIRALHEHPDYDGAPVTVVERPVRGRAVLML